jgi:hypothetical protein
MVEEARAVLAMFRTVVLVLTVLVAGVIGGYVGGIVAAVDLSQARQASHSPGLPGLEAIYRQPSGGTFEQLGRVIDQFNAQFDENWRTWESLGSYVFVQGWAELKRAWSGPTAKPSIVGDI